MSKGADVLFVYTNINGFHSDVYSFGIGYLSSVLKNSGFQPKLIIVRSKKDYKKVLKAVLEERPKVIGFSAVSSQFVFICELAKMIKRIHKGIIVCGGVHPTIFPESLFSSFLFDGFFIGESESSFVDFVSNVRAGARYQDTDNFCYVDTNRLVKNKLRPRVKNLEDLPFPDRDIYDYQSIINENNSMATIMTSRGCPFHCTYCSNYAIARVYGEENNIIRYNSVEKSLEEIDVLKTKYTFDKLYFIDDLFILNRNWLDDFLPNYKKRFKLSFMCHIRPDVCTKDILFRLKDAGCYRIFLAVESANDYIRNVVFKRDITKAQLENVFTWAKEAGLETQSVNIIGVPNETEETILETINFNRKMNPTVTGVNIFSPYEGTELGDYCREKGLLRKNNPCKFFDRRQSRLTLPTIKNAKLMKLYKRFQYLVYKDIDLLRARRVLWISNYERLERNIFLGPFFRRFRKIAKLGGNIMLPKRS